MTTKRGNELTPEEQKHVLAAYCHRSTPTTRTGRSGVELLQFASDEEWLANTEFDVTKTGKLDMRRKGCCSFPTWPNNPERRRPDSVRLQFPSASCESDITRLTPVQKKALQDALFLLKNCGQESKLSSEVMAHVLEEAFDGSL